MAAAAVVAAEVAGVAERPPAAGPPAIVGAPEVVAAQSPSGDAALDPAVAVVGSLAQVPDDSPALPWAW